MQIRERRDKSVQNRALNTCTRVHRKKETRFTLFCLFVYLIYIQFAAILKYPMRTRLVDEARKWHGHIDSSAASFSGFTFESRIN